MNECFQKLNFRFYKEFYKCWRIINISQWMIKFPIFVRPDPSITEKMLLDFRKEFFEI